jgi:hypothetical protein
MRIALQQDTPAAVMWLSMDNACCMG